MNPNQLTDMIGTGSLDTVLNTLYGKDDSTVSRQRRRVISAVHRFAALFPIYEDVHLYSAPGRTEIGGNHTDHQNGCAVAAAVDLDVLAVVAFHRDGVIRLYSEGYGMNEVSLCDLDVHEEEKGTTVALIRGIVSRFAQMNVKVNGFDAYITSDVLSGSGLSSSAAFEVLLATIINDHDHNGSADATAIAKIGQYAENVYFGKGSGLLDQMVSAVGGFVLVDFGDPEQPVVRQCDFDFATVGYRLCITDTKGSHSDLSDEYTAVPNEMRSVAATFGKSALREVDEERFFAAIPELRDTCSDRAILRAIHFFDENRRAKREAEALEQGDMERFLALYRQSADSSAALLQNLYSVSKPDQQGIPLAIAVSRRCLGESGAVRVHGGGFAGTIQAIVPFEKTADYVAQMDRLFGQGSCRILHIRPVGGIKMI